MDSLLTDEEIDAIEEDTTGNAIHKMDSVPFARAIEAAVIAKLKEWQPIETAPKDGTEVLVYVDGFGLMHWIDYDEAKLWIWSEPLLSDADPDPIQPTHWMPLPPPPTDQEKRNG